ncbi:MAG: ribulose-phosphate 3-epimerase [Muribaculaceae bacterium]
MQISPSILSADFANLQRDIEMLNDSDATMVHLDIMDGVFVPNISFGFPVMKAVQRYSSKPLDVHLMIVEPQKYVSQVRDCGAAIMNVHYEACIHLDRTIQQIKQAGMKAAVTLNPATPVELLRDIVAEVDMVLLMSVNPGFGGQKFIPNTINKVKRLRQLMSTLACSPLIEVDGGVNMETGALLADAGADVLVAGNSVFSAPDPAAAIKALSSL